MKLFVRFCLLALLFVVEFKAQQVSQFFKKKADGSASTPENNTVLASTCTGTPAAMQCTPVSFLILTDLAFVQKLSFDPINRTWFNGDNFQTCAEPQGAFDQKCGFDTSAASVPVQTSKPSEWGVTPDASSTCSVSSCDFTPASTISSRCACVGGTGTCSCFNTTRLTVQPIAFRSVTDSRICFTATPWSSTLNVERRCVFIAMLLPTDNLVVTVGEAGAAPTVPSSLSTISNVNSVVGSQLVLTVRTRSFNPFESVDIDVKSQQTALPSSSWSALQAELPSQSWKGPTLCSSTSAPSTAVGLASPCAGGWWHRTLYYTPRGDEKGMQYSVGFQVTRQGLSPRAFQGQTFYRNPLVVGASNGSACGMQLGLCVPAQGTPDDRSDIVVNVSQRAPTFVLGVVPSAAYPAFAAGTPPPGSVLKAYPNCPMAASGVYVLRARPDRDVVLSLLPGSPDATRFGLSARGVSLHVAGELYSSVTPSDSQIGLIPGDGFSYAQVQWTPPPESAGRTYPICMQAQDPFSTSTQCFAIQVVACMYCTSPATSGSLDPVDTVQSLAARFKTNWLQIWSANDGDLMQPISSWLTPRGAIQPWVYAVDPSTVVGNTLVRLGPMYHLRHDTTLQALATRFRTTVEALVLANPNLADPLRASAAGNSYYATGASAADVAASSPAAAY